jgi:rhodanese-related sulfurtransferase
MTLFAQKSISQVLKRLNKETVPYVKVNELRDKKNIVFFDAREPKEFKVSHIYGALFVGYDHFDPAEVIANVKRKNATIVVYCSIGVRSERIGEKVQKLGYTNVYNLYGGIFEYKNNDGKVVNDQNKITDSVHTYNKKWSVYLSKGTKIYED